MTTPNEKHLPCDRREILGHAAYSEYRRQTEIYAGQMQEWLNLPEGVKTEWRNVGEAVADAVSPAPPALTGGVYLKDLSENITEIICGPELSLEVAKYGTAKELKSRITALSAQVAELTDELTRTVRNNQTDASLIESLGNRAEKAERQVAEMTVSLSKAGARIAGLERDKERLDWLVDSLEVDMEINGAVPLDHIDAEAWNTQGGEECDATRTAWRNAIDAAMSKTKQP